MRYILAIVLLLSGCGTKQVHQLSGHTCNEYIADVLDEYLNNNRQIGPLATQLPLDIMRADEACESALTELKVLIYNETPVPGAGF